MSEERDLFFRLKDGQPPTQLTDGDKALIYSGKPFMLPGAHTTTTLINQIVLLPNASEILSTLDPSQLKGAICSGYGISSPLGLLIEEIACGRIGFDVKHQSVIRYLVKHGAILVFIKYALSEDYYKPNILAFVEQCEKEAASEPESNLCTTVEQSHSAHNDTIAPAGEAAHYAGEHYAMYAPTAHS